MPVTIGVYIQPGRITAGDGTVLRFNRSNEFDATDSRFAEFLDTELFPAVEALTTPNGRRVKLSLQSHDRMIFGLSSGGIAAFTAAWHRPDMFGKVFCGCGTFVPMRGGHGLQAIVRKHEPKPLRIFLQDGFSDTWNPLFGSWYEANRMLGTALEFAGYDCSFDWVEGGHSVKRATEIFADVMKWMWRDYPAAHPVRPTANNLLAPMLKESGEWQEAVQDATVEFDTQVSAVYPDGSHMAEPAQGTNFLTQHLLSPAGEKQYSQRFYWLHTYDNALLTIPDMTFDGDGNLWVVTNAGIQVCDQNGRVRGILSLPADLAVNPDTRIAITDGQVWLQGLSTKTGAVENYMRRLSVKAATKGVRPKSQGQG